MKVLAPFLAKSSEMPRPMPEAPPTPGFVKSARIAVIIPDCYTKQGTCRRRARGLGVKGEPPPVTMAVFPAREKLPQSYGVVSTGRPASSQAAMPPVGGGRGERWRNIGNEDGPAMIFTSLKPKSLRIPAPMAATPGTGRSLFGRDGNDGYSCKREAFTSRITGHNDRLVTVPGEHGVRECAHFWICFQCEIAEGERGVGALDGIPSVAEVQEKSALIGESGLAFHRWKKAVSLGFPSFFHGHKVRHVFLFAEG